MDGTIITRTLPMPELTTYIIKSTKKAGSIKRLGIILFVVFYSNTKHFKYVMKPIDV